MSCCHNCYDTAVDELRAVTAMTETKRLAVMEVADREQISDDSHAAYDARASVRRPFDSALNQWLIRPIGSCIRRQAIALRVASTPGT